MKKQRNNIRFYAIDLLQLWKFIFHYLWAVILCGVVTSLIGFCVSTHLIAPMYCSTAKFYVNNISFSTDNADFNVDLSELQVAQQLVRTYGTILNSHETLEQVNDKLDAEYTHQQLSAMIRCSLSSDTEFMCVKVICDDLHESEIIASAVAEILPTRVSEIIKEGSPESISCISIDTARIGPNVFFYTIAGAFLGFFLSLVVFIILGLLDNTVYDEEYVMRIYDYPILGKVPNLIDPSSRSYGCYNQKKGRINRN